MIRIIQKVSARLVASALLVVASLGILTTQPPEPALGNQKTITFTGTVDCGRRDSLHCTIGESITLWTEDLGGMQQVTIYVNWIKDSLPDLDQGDFLCLEVFALDGGYQASGVVPCQSADKVKKPQPKDQLIATPTATPTPRPGATPTSAPKVIIDIAIFCQDAHSSPLIAAGTGGLEIDSGLAFFQPECGTFEGDTMFFEVTLRSSINEQVTVQFNTQDITAIGGPTCQFRSGEVVTDYITHTQTVTFPPNSTSQTVEVETCFDNIEESDETLRGVLSNPSSNASIGIGSAIGTIYDNSD